MVVRKECKSSLKHLSLNNYLIWFQAGLNTEFFVGASVRIEHPINATLEQDEEHFIDEEVKSHNGILPELVVDLGLDDQFAIITENTDILERGVICS